MGRKALAAAAMGLGLVEHLGLVWYAIAAIIYERRNPSDMPFGYLLAFVCFVILATSIPSARWLYLHLDGMGFGRDDRLLWTGTGMLIAPWIGVWLHILAYRNSIWLGPLGVLAIFLAPMVGSAAPYLVIGLLV
jgi:hypothetical protein